MLQLHNNKQLAHTNMKIKRNIDIMLKNIRHYFINYNNLQILRF